MLTTPDTGNFDFRPQKTLDSMGREPFEKPGIYLVATTDGVEGDGSFKRQEDGSYYLRWLVWTGDVPGAMKSELERMTGKTFLWKKDEPPPGVVYQGQGRGSAYLVPEPR